MEIGPIFRALLRNKTGAILIALQIAFTMTVTLNIGVMIQESMAQADRPSGMNEMDTFHLLSFGYAKDFKTRVTIENDLRELRQLPGVVNAIQINAFPLSDGGWAEGVRTSQDQDAQSFSPAVYLVDENAIETLGVNLVAGRNFTSEEVTWRGSSKQLWPPVVIVSQSLAASLFPDDDPLNMIGKVIVIGETPTSILGVVEKLQSPWTGSSNVEQSMLIPQYLDGKTSQYMIRAEPGRRDALMLEVEELLSDPSARGAGRIIRDVESMEETRRRGYNIEIGLSKVMGFVMVVLLLITGLGILGLASLSVRRRTKQIGIRRAMGATTGNVLRYFLIENLLITSFGVVLGAFMSVAFNMWLVDLMNFPQIAWYGIPLGAIILVALGQLAVLGPANRACRVSPAIATRTV